VDCLSTVPIIHALRAVSTRRMKFVPAPAPGQTHLRSERNVVVGNIVAGIVVTATGRSRPAAAARSTRVGGAATGLTAVAAIIHRCAAAATPTITPAIEHLHLIGDDFGGVAILTVLALPFSSLNTALDIDLAALLQVFAGDFAEPIEQHDPMPLGLFLRLAGLLVLPAFTGRQVEIADRIVARRVADLGIGTKIADQDCFVDSSAHGSPVFVVVVSASRAEHPDQDIDPDVIDSEHLHQVGFANWPTDAAGDFLAAHRLQPRCGIVLYPGPAH